MTAPERITEWPALMRSALAAAYLDTSTSTFARLRERKELPPPVMLGESQRWRRSDLDSYIGRMRQVNS